LQAEVMVLGLLMAAALAVAVSVFAISASFKDMALSAMSKARPLIYVDTAEGLTVYGFPSEGVVIKDSTVATYKVRATAK